MIYCPECTKNTAKLLKLGDNVKPIYKIECEHCGVATIGCEDLEWVIDTWAFLNSMSRRDDSTKPEVKSDPNNPYTDFAREMSLLHEALKAEYFKDSMVDILAKMTPIVWDRVEREKAHERLKAAVKDLNKVEYEPPEWIKNLNEKNQKREAKAWEEARKRVLLK